MPQSFPERRPGVRTAARALVLQDGRLLTVLMRDAKGEFHILPGGGQRHGEALAQTVRRECREELGVEVEVGDIAYVRDYIGRNHDFSARHRHFHQVEVVFRCRLRDPLAVLRADNPAHDKLQIGAAWLPIADVGRARFYPAVIKPFFSEAGFCPPNGGYLGDVN